MKTYQKIMAYTLCIFTISGCMGVFKREGKVVYVAHYSQPKLITLDKDYRKDENLSIPYEITEFYKNSEPYTIHPPDSFAKKGV